MRLRCTSPALGDLESIGDYISRDSPAAAARIVAEILDQAETLTLHPHIGRPGRVPGTRELVVANTPHIAAYRVIDDAVQALTVIHGARQWPENFA